MFDAYTIKKVLPRLVAAVILIQLSWFIFTSMVGLTNIVSYGLEAIITAPFGGTQMLADGPLNAALDEVGKNGGAKLDKGGYFVAFAGVGGAGAILAGSMGIFAIVSIVVGFLVLAIRRIMILALILIAPLALVAWILPGTQRFWKMWWDNFTKLLLMFPLIVVMVSAGAALAQVVAISNMQNNLVGLVLIFACIFTPFFLIPKTYNLAGAGLGLAAGWIAGKASAGENWAQGVRKKKRAERWQRRGQDFQRGNLGGRRFRNTRFGQRVNRMSAGAASGAGNRFGLGAAGAGAMDLRRRQWAAEEAKNNALLQQGQFDDNGIAVLALSGGTDAGARRAAEQIRESQRERRANGENVHVWSEAEMNAAIGTARAMGINGSTATAAIDLMAQNKSRLLPAGDVGAAMVATSAAQIAGGNAQMRNNIMGSFAFHSRNAGRLDHGGDPTPDGQAGSLQDGWNRSTTQAHAQSQGPSMQAFADNFGAGGGIDSGDQGARAASAIALYEMHNMLPGATATNQEIINQALEGAGIRLNDPNATVAQQLAARSNGAINETDIIRSARAYGAEPLATRGGTI